MKAIFSFSLVLATLIGCSLFNNCGGSKISINVDLFELPTATEDVFKSNFGITSIDRNTNEIEMSKSAFVESIKSFTSTAIINDDINEFSFYLKQSHPRLCYWEYIINQLPSYVDYGYKYDAYSDKKDEKRQQLAFLSYRINRSGKNISTLFNASKETFYTLVDKEKFQAYGLDAYVNSLLDTYTHLKSLSDYDDQMKRIYSEVKEEDNNDNIFGRTSNQYPIYEQIINGDIQSKYAGTNGMVLNEFGEFTDVLWFHSFWVRRYQEGNSEAVVKILKEIKTHYDI